jgi:uncharacterized protein
MKMVTKYIMRDGHWHTFLDVDTPDNIFPLEIVKSAQKDGIKYKTVKFLCKTANPFRTDDMLDRVINIVEISKLGSQKKIIEKGMEYYPDDVIIYVLTMDMAFMGAGKVKRPYDEQVREICELSRINRNIKVFLHIDPRRPGILQMLKDFHKCYGIAGIKIYPPLGYAPNHPVLMECYDFCERKGLAVISHCSPANPVHYKGTDKELYKLLDEAGLKYNKKMKRKELCALFTDPNNWIEIAEKFPNLPIDLAHMGSEVEMLRYLKNPKDPNNFYVKIKNLAKKYDNIFSDTSFSIANESLYPTIYVEWMQHPILYKKLIFGTDFFVNAVKSDMKVFCLNYRKEMGEDAFKQQAHYNAISFENFKKLKMKEDKTQFTEITDSQIIKEINDIEELKI